MTPYDYEIIKSLHIIALVCWFAGLFYLPRLFVYHVNAEGQEAKAMLVTMEHKLYTYITTPAMLATWVFGLWLLAMEPGWAQGGWLHVKIALVLGLTGYHGTLKRHMKRLKRDENKKDARFFRLYNEVPTVVLILVILLVELKPF